MKAQRTILGLAAAAAMLTGGVAEANRTYYTHGTLCQPFYGNSGNLSYGEIGVGNWASGNAYVTCPGISTYQTQHNPGGGWWTVQTATVHVQDNNATQPFSCSLWGLDGGWVSWGPVRYSCSQAGGCPDSTSSYTGYASLTFDGNPVWFDSTIGTSCTMPPTGPYASWIEDLESTTTEP